MPLANAVPVTMIGTDANAGAPILDGTVAVTPGEKQPNLVVSVITPLVAIAVRFVNVFLVTFLGVLGAAGIGVGTSAPVPADFATVCQAAAGIALVSASIGAAKDCVTIFKGLENKFPLLTGSV